MTRFSTQAGPLPIAFLFLGVLFPGALWADESREVTFEGHDGFELSGTLVLPDGDAPAPGLVLLPGSGPTDRDGNQPPGFKTDLLKAVAERLADEGYATLRFDKRAAHVHMAKYLGLGLEEQREFFSFEAFVGDARAAVEVLRTTEGIDAGRIGVFGHSEGGLFALELGRELGAGEDGIAALVLAATPGRPLADVLRFQIDRNLRALPESLRDKFMKELDRAIETVVTDGRPPTDLEPGLAGLFPPSAGLLLQVELALDPAELARQYGGPVLVLQGERDIQVTADDNPGILEAAFRERSTGECEVALVPSASHNFKHVESEGELGMKGDVVPATFEALVPWLRGALPLRDGER